MEFFHFCNGLCYNWQEAITLNSFHIIPFYWVVWSLFSIKDLKEFRNGFFFCPAISFSCRALGELFQPDANIRENKAGLSQNSITHRCALLHCFRPIFSARGSRRGSKYSVFLSHCRITSAFFSSRFMRQTASVRTSKTLTSAKRTCPSRRRRGRFLHPAWPPASDGSGRSVPGAPAYPEWGVNP